METTRKKPLGKIVKKRQYDKVTKDLTTLRVENYYEEVALDREREIEGNV